ncbi:MAG TPA: hypothetical protein PLG32_01150 [Piscinibacter sp.]|jgi:hypothetical protein|nr:hypothetical protein [Piscinibacter sp.]HOY33715.1 hypothetical protein [Piscinibacter sp.]
MIMGVEMRCSDRLFLGARIPMALRALAVVLAVLAAGCGNMFVDTSYLELARKQAANPNLTEPQRGKIFEEAGDQSLIRGRGGFAAEMYFEAALAYDVSGSTQGDADVRRVYGKCLSGRLQTAAECQSIADVMSDWKAGRAEPAGRAGPAPGPSFSYVFPGNPAVGGTALPPRAAPVVPGSIDGPIQQAQATRATRPRVMDGCPTGIEHLAPQLPVCAANEGLVKLRQLILATDASFVEDQAAGLSLREVALRTSQASRLRDEALKTTERSMLEASADSNRARRRLAALRDSPPSCDAGPSGSYGMGESAYQAYVGQYMVAMADRAVSAAAACRARARP